MDRNILRNTESRFFLAVKQCKLFILGQKKLKNPFRDIDTRTKSRYIFQD